MVEIVIQNLLTNAIKFCNSVLKQMGSDKTHGSEVLFTPKFPLKHRAKRGVCGNHAWYYDDSVGSCGDDFEIIIPKKIDSGRIVKIIMDRPKSK